MPSSIHSHSDDQLRFVSHYLRYHIRMYVETLLWLETHVEPTGWDTEWNAILEDHLVHARLLINFLRPPGSWPEDVNAEDYFGTASTIYSALPASFLKNHVDRIGGRLVHITKHAVPDLKSHQYFEIRPIAVELVPALQDFLRAVSDSLVADNVKTESLDFLAKLSLGTVPVSLYHST